MLTRTCNLLTSDLRSSTLYHDPERFEQHVQDTLRHAAEDLGLNVTPSFHPHAFPDIRANGFGVEVKYTKQDTWVAVGNSIFEGMRDRDVDFVYVIYGKAGGEPQARWAKYEDCISHVRVSHAPRFTLDMETKSRLFDLLPVSYQEFAILPDDEKMRHIRDYSRGRLGEGERLWWLEPEHTVPVAVRFYMNLEKSHKQELRAEAALLFPSICADRYTRGKYNDASLYLLMHHGVFCPQARDLWTAGSVAGSKGDGNNPEGLYIMHALADIQDLIRDVAFEMDDALFVTYWGESCAPERRITRWLELADAYAAPSWRPSEHLFTRDD